MSTYGKKFAPGENSVPIPLNRDLDAERMSFPTIYGGQEMEKTDVRLSYTDIYKSELRRYDRRCAKPEKILFTFRKAFNEKVYSAYNICLRQKKKGDVDGPLTAGELKRPGGVKNVISNDDGYRVYKHIRSSPAYWKEQSKRVVAMVRQLGRCTFFITLSAAETKWNELMVILEKIINNKKVTEEDVRKMSFEEKAELIRSDPVTCMRHFDHKYRTLLNELFKKPNGVFAPNQVNDYYSRVEFQVRGSPHSHGLYWLKDAPKYEEGKFT